MTLADMVSGLQDGYYKDYFRRHMERGLHSAEEEFASCALLSLAPDVASPEEKEAAARHILQTSLDHLPETRSGEIFAAQMKQRFPRGVLRANLDIEEMIFIANISSCLRASADASAAKAAEKVLHNREEELLRWATVAGQRPALPVAIEGGLFWLYYMDRNLGGVCMHSLPGRGQGLPVIFVDEETFAEGPEDAVLRAACHEMIHSSQRISVEDPLDGWSPQARQALLEAVTEGLAICRVGRCEGFSSEEIVRRDYAYFVIALFEEMIQAGTEPVDFPEELERMNIDLEVAAKMVGSSENFLGKSQTAMSALLLRQIQISQAGRAQSRSEEEALRYLDETLSGLGVVQRVLRGLR